MGRFNCGAQGIFRVCDLSEQNSFLWPRIFLGLGSFVTFCGQEHFATYGPFCGQELFAHRPFGLGDVVHTGVLWPAFFFAHRQFCGEEYFANL